MIQTLVVAFVSHDVNSIEFYNKSGTFEDLVPGLTGLLLLTEITFNG